MKAFFGAIVFVSLVLGAQALISVTGIGLPPAIIAMVGLTLALAALRRVPPVLEKGAAFLFRIFPLLFIPAVVGVVEVWEIVAENWLVLLFAITGSSLLALWVSAQLYRLLRARKRSSL